jgi:transposase
MAKEFREYSMDQMFLLPPDIREWLPSDHRAWFVSQVVDDLNLSHIESKYQSATGSGPRAYAPRMMLKVLLYGYCVGIRSSRKLERATVEYVAFRVLSGGQHPDHDTIASFRREHLAEVEDLFIQVLGLCKKAGLLKLGHLVLDGTKLKASANKSKSRTYDQLNESELELSKKIREMLEEAERIDQAEDKIYGKGKREEDLPEALNNDEKRLRKIRELKRQIEEESQQEREKVKAENLRRREEDEKWVERTGQKIEKRYPQEPGVGNKPLISEARRNPTDFDSRVMKENQTGGFIQGYNCQAVVTEDQIIVVAEATSHNNDKNLAPLMMDKVKSITGQLPEKLSADAGYFGERDLVRLKGIDCYIPPLDRDKGKRFVWENGEQITLTEQMRQKLQRDDGKALYRRRKSIVEPIFGQIKEARGFRQFLLRSIEKVDAEWKLASLCHNINKLFTADLATKMSAALDNYLIPIFQRKIGIRILGNFS